jgi:hypothetical protein
MRAMELGLKALAQSLGAPDPLESAKRNWGSILDTIAEKIKDRDSGTRPWTYPSDKSFFLEMHASLNAVRMAWRNPTMHVEKRYTVDRAENIFLCVSTFMKMLASRMDENGKPEA